LVQSTIAAGTIRSINAAKAEAAPGVLTVITHQNAPVLPVAPPAPFGYGPPAPPFPLRDNRIVHHGQRAIADGATLVAGGKRMDRPGYYIEPTVLANVDPSSEIAQIEVFGPVVAITTFATDEEAIAIANSTRYGLSSYIQTRDLTRAHRIAAELEAGEVLINGAPNLAVHRPFGGIGISGVGKEGGRAGFEEFLRVKSVALAIR
jgi:aldehyde dehydrogenase (NAD+)